MDQYAVLGHPISHSKSPQIHQAFADQCQQALEYRAIELPLDGFSHCVRHLIDQGFKGFNITVPFKEEAFEFANQLTERAQRAGAVNTFKVLENGEVLGDTSDGEGLVQDILINHQFSFKGKRVLVLGAGGAVRGIIEPILAQGPAELVIANRTVQKAQTIADIFNEFGRVSGCGFEEIQGTFDLIINGTSASLEGTLPAINPELFKSTELVYDMMYGSGLTVFNQWAREQGASKTVDGLGMLVGQAAVSFEIWRQVKPETQTVIDALRQQLA